MIVVPLADQFAELGDGATLSATVAGTDPLGFRWYHDDVVLAETSVPELELQNLASADSGAYRIEVTNQYGSKLSDAGQLTVRVTRPNSFAMTTPNNSVIPLAIQTDGKILVGGYLTTIDGEARTAVARLWPDGSLDRSFDAGPIFGDSPTIGAVGLLPNGNILVGGNFWQIGGRLQTSLALLHPDGSLVESFKPPFDATSGVYSMVIQADDKIVVSGFLRDFNGEGGYGIVRLLPSGNRDDTFQSGANSSVVALALQEDGRIVAGGEFTSISSQSRERVARLLPDGSLDPTFVASADNWVSSIFVQPDGKILIGGSFTTVNGVDCGNLARLNADGALDLSFDPQVRSTSSFYGATALALQADGRIIVGGDFSSVGGVRCVRLARLFSDGSLDRSFSPEPDSLVSALTVSPSGEILVGGWFSNIGGVARRLLAAFDNTDSPVNLLYNDSLRLTWKRSGGGPEFSRVQFETTEDGIDWTALGVAERTTGGWELTGAALPARGSLRARGWVGGQFDGSNWFTDEYLAFGDFANSPFDLTLELLNGDSVIQLHGEAGIPYQIEYQSEVGGSVSNWSTMPPFVPSNGNQTISLPLDVQHGRRFFRAHVVQ